MESDCVTRLMRDLLPDRVTYLGTFAADTLPQPDLISNFPACLIVNTEIQSQPGQHWIAMYMPNRNVLFYFDSLGRPYHINIYFTTYVMKVFKPEIIQLNLNRIQAANSGACGLYCIKFLIQISNFQTFDAVINSFTCNPKLNDLFTYCQLKSIGNLKKYLSYSKDFQNCVSIDKIF